MIRLTLLVSMVATLVGCATVPPMAAQPDMSAIRARDYSISIAFEQFDQRVSRVGDVLYDHDAIIIGVFGRDRGLVVGHGQIASVVIAGFKAKMHLEKVDYPEEMRRH